MSMKTNVFILFIALATVIFSCNKDFLDEKEEEQLTSAKKVLVEEEDCEEEMPECIDSVTTAVDKEKEEWGFHTVEAGESMYVISRLYEMSLDALLALNPGIENGLQVGQKLKIPISDAAKKIAEKMKPAKRNVFSNPFIGNGVVCGLKRNMPMSKVLAQFKDIKKNTFLDDEGGSYKIYGIYNGKSEKPSIQIVPDCNGECVIGQILILDPLFKTKKGLRVGSTFADIMKAHDEIRISHQGRAIMIYTKKLDKVAFMLSNFSIEWRPNGEYFVKDIPDDVSIAGIYL
ncbi:MAG: hypothetical protein COA57_06220 [Flavobacteriales bacterium]|nr:MAG: hypothetical protein COA57_06220 [Flavobacteriales bacterium]